MRLDCARRAVTYARDWATFWSAHWTTMKFAAAQINSLIRGRTRRRNLRVLLRFLLVLIGMITLFSVIFHELMAREGQQFSWITSFYWTLTVMSTLGFGDITFQSGPRQGFLNGRSAVVHGVSTRPSALHLYRVFLRALDAGPGRTEGPPRAA